MAEPNSPEPWRSPPARIKPGTPNIQPSVCAAVRGRITKLPADHEEGGLQAVAGQDVEHALGDARGPGHRSSRANSSWGTRTKTDRRPICRNPKFFPARAATWRIAACKNMWAGFVTSCANMVKLPRSRSSWRRSLWAAGARRTARVGARERRSGTRRRSAAEQ